MIFKAQAPSNIALIKYMGKEDSLLNLPANDSISLTLHSFYTETELSVLESPVFEVVWVKENQSPALSAQSTQKIKDHVLRVIRGMDPLFKGKFGFSGSCISFYLKKRIKIRSTNNFPVAVGLASSASGFAALTLVAAKACLGVLNFEEDAFFSDPKIKSALACLSRQGSGSSCRSFYGPWVHWHKAEVTPLITNMPEMVDLVLMVSEEAKSISSTEAHERVKSSPHWGLRGERVAKRVKKIIPALKNGDIKTVSKITWDEMWDMHSLFHTAKPSFTYWNDETHEILKFLEESLKNSDWSFVVTADAGPNVHVLMPKENQFVIRKMLENRFPAMKILAG